MSITLQRGDCLELFKEIPDGSVDFVLTDIPFKISRENNFQTMKDRTGRNGIDFGKWDKEFDESNLAHFIPKIKASGGAIVFHDFAQMARVREVLEGSGMVYKDFLIWEKTNPMPRNRDRRYVSNIESASWYVMRGAKWTFNRRSEKYDGCVMRYPSESGGGFKRYHPCQKTVKLLEELIRRHTNEGDLIFDPYMGSGSTGVACVNTGRSFIGMELYKKYFQIAQARVAQAEGGTA